MPSAPLTTPDELHVLARCFAIVHGRREKLHLVGPAQEAEAVAEAYNDFYAKNLWRWQPAYRHLGPLFPDDAGYEDKFKLDMPAGATTGPYVAQAFLLTPGDLGSESAAPRMPSARVFSGRPRTEQPPMAMGAAQRTAKTIQRITTAGVKSLTKITARLYLSDMNSARNAAIKKVGDDEWQQSLVAQLHQFDLTQNGCTPEQMREKVAAYIQGVGPGVSAGTYVPRERVYAIAATASHKRQKKQ